MPTAKQCLAFVIGAAVLALAATSIATTLHAVQVKCPVCGTELSSMEVGSTNNFGGQDRDLLRRAVGDQAFMAAATTCPKCHYSGYARDFVQVSGGFGKHDSPEISDEVKKAILEGKALKVPPGAGDPMPAWAKLDLIAQIDRLKKVPDEKLGWAYLSAAWAVRLEDHSFQGLGSGETPQEIRDLFKKGGNRADNDVELAKKLLDLLPKAAAETKIEYAATAGYLLRTHGENEALLQALPVLKTAFKADEWPKVEQRIKESIELERGYQRQAMAAFESALASPAPLSDPKAAGVVTYLVGETARRLGETDKARTHFEKTAKVPGTPDWILDWAKEQSRSFRPRRSSSGAFARAWRVDLQ